MATKILALLAALMLTACGGGDDDAIECAPTQSINANGQCADPISK